MGLNSILMCKKTSRFYIPSVNYLAWWSRGMIRASGARGPGFNSRPSPTIFFLLDEIIKIKQMKKLEFLRFKLETRMGKKLQVEGDSPYYTKVVGKLSVLKK